MLELETVQVHCVVLQAPFEAIAASLGQARADVEAPSLG